MSQLWSLVLTGVKQIACGEFAHLFQLILTMFRADEEFDRAFAVIPVVHRD
jgi:hypothetical protein